MQPDFNEILETALTTLGGSPTSREVEAAAIRLLEQRLSKATPTNRSNGLKNEVEAVQYSISLAACASRRSSTQRARVYETVRRATDLRLQNVFDTSRTLGLNAVPEVELRIRDTNNLFAGHDVTEFGNVCDAIQSGVLDGGGRFVLGPFLDLSLADNLCYLDSLGDCLGKTHALIPLVQVGTEQDPPCSDILYALSLVLATHQHTLKDHNFRVAIVVNGCERRAYGKRMSVSSTGFSVAFCHEEDVQLAVSFGRELSGLDEENTQFLQVEHRLPSPPGRSSLQQGLSPRNGLRFTELLDGFPAYASNPNRISFPLPFSAEEMATFLDNRLSPFSFSGKESGVVIEMRAT